MFTVNDRAKHATAVELYIYKRYSAADRRAILSQKIITYTMLPHS